MSNETRFYNTSSTIHRMNIFIKILLAILFCISVLISKTLITHVFLGVFLLILIGATNVPIILYLKAIWNFKYIYFIILIIDLLIFKNWLHLLMTFVSLTMVVLMILIVIFSTRIKMLETVVEIFLLPLKLFGVDTSKLATKITNINKFSTIYKEEQDKVIKSQKNKESKMNLLTKIKNKFKSINPTYNKSKERMERLEEVATIRNGNEVVPKNYAFRTTKMDFALITVQIFILIALIMKG